MSKHRRKNRKKRDDKRNVQMFRLNRLELKKWKSEKWSRNYGNI